MDPDALVIIQILIFIAATGVNIAFSRKSLRSIKFHGFYRFFVFEAVTGLIVINFPFWVMHPFSIAQIISWVFLFLSIAVVLQGVYLLKRKGGSQKRNSKSANYRFEDTVDLVYSGIYRFIRHPMYCSLILLAAGALLKNVNYYTVFIFSIVLVSAFATAKIEEKENILFFGSVYEEYMNKTKMFIPFLF